MEPIFACALLFLSFVAEPALSLQCYNCTASQMTFQGAPTMTPAETNCMDPFNMEGIEKIDCDGKCFGQMITTEGLGVIVTRGCSPSVEMCSGGCFAMSGPPQGGPPQGGAPQPEPEPEPVPGGMTPPPGMSIGGGSGEICRFCCDGDLCNNVVIEETARAQAPPPVNVEGTRNCWKCEEAKSDATDGSCASDEFNGKGATKVECNAQCVLLKGQNDQGVDSVYRDCDPSSGAMCQMPGAMCCTGELCNGDEESGDGDDDDDVKPIDCWKCEAPVSDKNESDCSKGKFKEETASITKVTCPTGKCVKLVNMVSANMSVFVRDCLLPMVGDDVCEKDAASKNDKYKGFSDIKCCSKNLCNGAPVVTSSLAAILLTTLYVLVSKAIM